MPTITKTIGVAGSNPAEGQYSIGVRKSMSKMESKKKEDVDENKAIRLALENSFEIQSEKLAKINEKITKLQGSD